MARQHPQRGEVSASAEKKAVRLYHEARRFERQTRAAAPKGHQDGALGRSGLLVLHTLIFDFLNFATGALFPSIASIAHAAGTSESSVKRGLAKLKASGVVNWLRRCAEDWQDGRFILRQETNAYGILPASQWRGYTPDPEAPPPPSGTWGDHPPLPDALTLACQEAAQGLPAMVRTPGGGRARPVGVVVVAAWPSYRHQGLKPLCFIGSSA